MSNKIISETLGIEYIPEAPGDEEEISVDEYISTSAETAASDENEISSDLTVVRSAAQELLGDTPDVGHVVQDYEFTREKMRSFILVGEEGLRDLMSLVKEEPSGRGYEVLATMLATVTDMSTKFFDLQKKNRELHFGGSLADGNKPGINIRNGAVFVGDSASMLEQLKAQQKAVKEDKN